MVNLQEMIDYYAKGISVRVKPQEDGISSSVYKIRIFSGMNEEEAGQLGLSTAEKDFFAYKWNR